MKKMFLLFMLLGLFNGNEKDSDNSFLINTIFGAIEKIEVRRNNIEKKYGTPYYTTLNIGDYYIDVFDTRNKDTAISQKVVDEKYSSAYLTFDYHTFLIADHVNQGFSVIKKLSEGDSFLLGEDEYIVTSVDSNATNKGFLYYSDGRCAVFDNDAELLLYTCNEKKPYITIVSCIKAEEGETE